MSHKQRVVSGPIRTRTTVVLEVEIEVAKAVIDTKEIVAVNREISSSLLPTMSSGPGIPTGRQAQSRVKGPQMHPPNLDMIGEKLSVIEKK